MSTGSSRRIRPYDQQLHFDAFSSKDLVTWTKHERIISNREISWLRRALWAPAIVQKDGRFYLFFGANDVHEGEIGGIGVAVARRRGPTRTCWQTADRPDPQRRPAHRSVRISG
jgi:hypothetical protein